MARGWESKSVESQIEDATSPTEDRRRESRAEIEQSRRRDDIEMSRRRIARELESSRSPVHRSALENAMRHLDDELRKLQK